MTQRLWTPPGAVVKPTKRKAEGGTFFDDELETIESQERTLQSEARRLITHINERPDHTVYVASADERTKMRAVFNYWKDAELVGHNPNIRIDYGVPEGTIRVDA